MSKLKDKLSASVRQAKASQDSVKQRGAAAKSAKPAPATPAKPAPATPAKPAAQTAKPVAAPRKTDKPAATSANQVRESGSELFPQRVWPD